MFKVIASPIRWAGSKKKLLNEMLFMFDRQKKIYVEPFLGSGIVLINVLNHSLYKEHYVNDNNENLINFYIELRDNAVALLNMINDYVQKYNGYLTIEEKSLFYYECRTRYNDTDTKELEKAVLFWFLMKTGFNGVYRINSKEKYNVPFGKREKIVFDENKMLILSNMIKDVHFYSLDYSDFLAVLDKKRKLHKAFIYCDPPYIPETKSTENHVIYSKRKFDHNKFKAEIKDVVEKNDLSVMISMSESENSKKMYTDSCFHEYMIADIVRKVNPNKRIESKEITYTNYSI